jgi:hypothetical protein
MKKLLTILAGALAVAWIAVPVAGAADVNGHARPGDVYASAHPDPWASDNGLRPHDVYSRPKPQADDVYASSWSRVRPNPMASSDSLRPNPIGSSDSLRPGAAAWDRIRPHGLPWDGLRLHSYTDVYERG